MRRKSRGVQVGFEASTPAGDLAQVEEGTTGRRRLPSQARATVLLPVVGEGATDELVCKAQMRV